MEAVAKLAAVEGEMFLVEGVLSDVHVEMGTENLLARIDRHYKGRSVVTGAGAVVGDLFGQVASAASLAMYDGEDTQNFMCLIDGQVMCGQFGGAEWLKNGHKVKAVVERREGVLVARGIVDPARGLLWTGHAWGGKAESRANWKIAGRCFGFGLICIALALALTGTGSWSFWETMWIAVVSLAAVCGGVALWANQDMQGLAAPSTQIFRLLGFDRPDEVNLNSYRISVIAMSDHLKDVNAPRHEAFDKSSHQTRDVYCYQRAITDGRLAMAHRAGAVGDKANMRHGPQR